MFLSIGYVEMWWVVTVWSSGHMGGGKLMSLIAAACLFIAAEMSQHIIGCVFASLDYNKSSTQQHISLNNRQRIRDENI